MEETEGAAERFGEVMLEVVGTAVSAGLEQHRNGTIEAVSDEVARRIEMAHVPEAVSLLDIAIRRDELASAEAALRGSTEPASVQARSAMLAADDLLRRFSNAIVEQARKAGTGTVAALCCAAAVAHFAMADENRAALEFAASLTLFC